MSFNTCRPTSRGSTHIRSADPLAAPAIHPNSLTSAEDVRDVFDGARIVRQIAAAGPLAAVTENEREPGSGVMADADVLAGFPAPLRHRLSRLVQLRDGLRYAYRGTRCAPARARRCRACAWWMPRRSRT